MKKLGENLLIPIVACLFILSIGNLVYSSKISSALGEVDEDLKRRVHWGNMTTKEILKNDIHIYEKLINASERINELENNK